MTFHHLAVVFLLNLLVLGGSLYWIYSESDRDHLESVVAIWSGPQVGTGFSIGNNWILSSDHVLLSQHHTYIQTRDGRIERATVVRRDPVADLVILQIKEIDLPPLRLDCSYEPRIRDEVEALGTHVNANVVWLNTFHRIASDMAMEGMTGSSRERAIIVQPTYQSGMSGGALIRKNKVIGVLRSINYAGSLPSLNEDGISVRAIGILGMSVAPDTICDFVAKAKLRMP